MNLWYKIQTSKFKSILLLSSCLLSINTKAEVAPADTARVIDLEDVVVIATPKEQGKLRQLPAAVTMLGQQDMQLHGITSLKGTSTVVPNLFIPDYGSRLTSAVYIRGVGSRINTPAVGLYVDNVPYLDKSAFDFPYYDIERIDVLRGPQGTLYGRNSMGGLIKVNTKNPFNYQGTDIRLSLASRSWQRRASITHYHRLSDKLAFSAGGYYDGSSGLWHNDFRHERQDKVESGGGRLRGILKPSEALKLDLSVAYDYTHEGGYPYFYMGSTDGTETYPDNVGRITSDEKSSYRRGMLNGGLNIEWQGKGFVMNAVTALQRLQDRMFMDQDFLSDSIYSLEQRQRLTVLSEEIVFKNLNPLRSTVKYEWLTGLSLSKQWLTTQSPVVFHRNGLNFLEQTINSYLDQAHQNSGAPQMGVEFNNAEMPTVNDFKSPVFNVAVFHQSTVNFTDRLSATLGTRLDYEHNSLTYLSEAGVNYNFLIMGRRMPQYQNLTVQPQYKGKMRDDNLEVLPKATLTWKIGKDRSSLLYLSAAKGHRAGGYNIQMFSDMLQDGMRTKMMSDLRPAHGEAEAEDLKGIVSYKPEFSWTYEAGTKLRVLESRLTLDAAIFLTSVRDQQIARFSDNGYGRMMVNAGRSRSWGAELSLKYAPVEAISAWASYGFTHATFTKYDDGTDQNYTHNYVPFIPRHTLSAGIDWKAVSSSMGSGQQSTVKFHSLTLGINTLGAGRIYWNEANSASQPIYFTFGAHAILDFGKCSINLWGRNLLDKNYHTFYFQSMGRAYAQKGHPVQVGVDLNIKLW